MNRFTFLEAAVIVGGGAVAGGFLTVAILVVPAMDPYFDAAAVSQRHSAFEQGSAHSQTRIPARGQRRPQ